MWHYIWGVICGAAGTVLLLSTAQAEPIQVPILNFEGQGVAIIDVPAGDPGRSAYQSWLDAGNAGTEAEFLASLKGTAGEDGDTPAPPNFSVTTLPPGSDATVSGTYPDLTLGIPRGDPGAPSSGGGSGTGSPMGPRTTMSCPGTLPVTVRFLRDVKMVAADGTDCVTINAAGQIVQLENVEISGGRRNVRVVRGGALVRDGEYYGFQQNGIMFDGVDLNAIVLARVDGAYIHDSKTGCVTYDTAIFGCKGPYGNGVVFARVRDGSVVNSKFERLEFGDVRSPSGRGLTVTGNDLGSTNYDSSIFFEFGWRFAMIANNHFRPTKGRGHRSAISLSNCDSDGGYQAVVQGNIFHGFYDNNWWVVEGACDILFALNIIDGDDPETTDNPDTVAVETSYLEKCYIAIALDGRNVKAFGNIIKNCRIGIAVERGSNTRAWLESNSFLNVDTPITGYSWNAKNLSAGTAHAPINPATVFAVNNRDAATFAVVNPQ